MMCNRSQLAASLVERGVDHHCPEREFASSLLALTAVEISIGQITNTFDILIDVMNLIDCFFGKILLENPLNTRLNISNLEYFVKTVLILLENIENILVNTRNWHSSSHKELFVHSS